MENQIVYKFFEDRFTNGRGESSPNVKWDYNLGIEEELENFQSTVKPKLVDEAPNTSYHFEIDDEITIDDNQEQTGGKFTINHIHTYLVFYPTKDSISTQVQIFIGLSRL